MAMTLVHWYDFTSPVVVVTWWLTLTHSAPGGHWPAQVCTLQASHSVVWQLLLT